MTRSLLPTLPEEILLEIFVRIPAKSVGRCRCTSKLWLANLSTPQFINLHRTRHQQENLLLISIGGKLHTIAPPIRDEAVSKELSGLPGNWKKVLGSCNGLVLLWNEEDELFLVNPITQQQVRVPNPPFPCKMKQNSSSWNETYGFGYDLSKDDYKILSLATYFERGGGYTFAHVYSLKMGIWKSLPCDFCHRSRPGVDAGAHVNGVIHWLTFKIVPDGPYMLDPELATFNFADEAFGVIPLPADECRYRFRAASVLRGCLILVAAIELDVVEAWIMKKYGAHESWTNFSIGGIRGSGSFTNQPLCFIGENEVMMVGLGLGSGSILLSNLETQESKAIVVDGTHSFILDGSVFVESLVTPSILTLVAEEKNDGTDIANNTLEAGPSCAPPGSSG